MPHCHSADASRNGPHLCASPFRMKAPSARFSGSLHLPLPVLVRELLMGGGASRASCPGGHPSPGPRPETLRQRARRRGPDMVPPTGHGCGRSSGRGMSVPRARPRRPPLPSQDLQASLKAAAGKISPLGTWAFPCAPVQVPLSRGWHCCSLCLLQPSWHAPLHTWEKLPERLHSAGFTGSQGQFVLPLPVTPAAVRLRPPPTHRGGTRAAPSVRAAGGSL